MYTKLIHHKEFGFFERMRLKRCNIFQLLEYKAQYDLINEILQNKKSDSNLGDFPYLINVLEFYVYRQDNKKQANFCQRLMDDLKEQERVLREKHRKKHTNNIHNNTDPLDFNTDYLGFHKFMEIRYGVLNYFIQRGKAADKILSKQS